jgi:hypothetical protein
MFSPRGVALVRTTSMVWGSASSSTTKTLAPDLAAGAARCAMAMASAAAVASSSMDAFATGRAVRSSTMVWKLSRASSRPWLISGWYGVYAVYQAGFSRTLRRMTAGVTVS